MKDRSIMDMAERLLQREISYRQQTMTQTMSGQGG
jgi:hypothetical protein